MIDLILSWKFIAISSWFLLLISIFLHEMQRKEIDRLNFILEIVKKKELGD
jgi:hypothetical protein